MGICNEKHSTVEIGPMKVSPINMWPIKVWLGLALALILSACSDMDADSPYATAKPAAQRQSSLFAAETYTRELISDNLAGTWVAVGNLRESLRQPYRLSRRIQQQRLFSIELSKNGEQYLIYEVSKPTIDDYSKQALLLPEPVAFSVFDSYFNANAFTAYIHNNDSITLEANQGRFEGELQLVKISDMPSHQVISDTIHHPMTLGTVNISFQRLAESGELVESGIITTELLNVAHTLHQVDWLSDDLKSFSDRYQQLDFFIAADAFAEALYGQRFVQRLDPNARRQLENSVQSIGLLNYELKNSLASEASRIDYAGVYNTVTDKLELDSRGGAVSFSFIFRNPWPDLQAAMLDEDAGSQVTAAANYTLLQIDIDFQF